MTDGVKNGVGSDVYEGENTYKPGRGNFSERGFFWAKTLSKFGEGKEQRVERVLSIQGSSGCT